MVPVAEPEEDATDKKLKKIYEPANRLEHEAMRRQHTRRQKANPVPRLKVTKKDGQGHISIDHANGAAGYTLLMEAMGTCNADFTSGLLNQIANIASPGQEVDENACNFVISVITGVEPRDQVEAMLGAQMAAVHMAMMTFSRRLSHAATILQQDADEKAFNKLARTFTAQVEALKRYRSKGEQRVYVERVNVEQGGQAIVGNVQHGGSEKNGG